MENATNSSRNYEKVPPMQKPLMWSKPWLNVSLFFLAQTQTKIIKKTEIDMWTHPKSC